MSHPYDATLKHLVANHPSDFVAAFGLPNLSPPAISLNVDLSTLTAATDVAFGFGDPMQEVVDLNFQSGPDPDLPARLNLYNAVLHFRHRVPVRSTVVLLRPKADGDNLSGNLSFGSAEHGVQFGYRVIRMWEQPVEPFLRGGLGLLPFATLCRLAAKHPTTDEIAEVIREIGRRVTNESSDADARPILTASLILAGLRIDKKQDLLKLQLEVSKMTEITCANDELIEEGRIDGYIRSLLLLGESKFGDADPDVDLAIREIKNVDHLKRMLKAVLNVDNWRDLLATK